MPEQITTKPFVSKRQQRMAFARKLPFARRWAKQTDFAALPEHKDAGAVAGASLHGPGGLLATPGMGTTRKPRKGRKWGMKLKDGYNARAGETIRGNLGRSNTGQFQRVGTANPDAPPAFGRGAPKKPRKGRGRKGRAPSKPKQTPEARQAARAAEHAQNQAKVLSGLGIDASGQAALDALRGGQQPDPKAIEAGKFEQSGLVEQAQDGSYRMTASGRAALTAAQAGDAGRASAIISSAHDRTLSRNERHTAAAVRQQASASRRAQVQARRDAAAAQRAAKLSAPKPAKASGSTKKPKHTSKKPTQDDAAANLARNLQRLSPTARDAISGRRPIASAPSPSPSPSPAPAKQRASGTPTAPAKARTKAQTEQEKAMFANMGGGGSGGSGGGKSGGGSKLWNKGPSGKRVPQAGFVSPKRTPATGEGKGRAADPGTPAHGQTSGNLTKAYGADPNQSYTMRHELVDMADIKASNTAGGGINPLYDPALQPRDRSRASSQAQIAEVAQKMNPDVLTTDFHRIDAGSPIIDAHGNVLSGNGRTLALQRAAELHPDKYADYKASVRAQAREAGIDPAAVDKMQHLDAMRDGAETVKSFIVYKDASGRDRWVARTTTAYQDRDGEIISEAALDQDSQRMTASKTFGPLRWWHVGDPDPLAPSAPWGPGLDLGDCDYSTVIGRTRVESGTFHDAEIARKVAARADDLEMSPGFFHPLDQPDRAGVFHTIRTFERSVVPVRYGRASNLFTGFTVKEFTMDIAEMEKRFKAAIVDLGLSAEQAQAFGQQLVQTEKDAQAQGIAYKDAAIEEMEYPDLEINGIIYKAAPPMASALPMDAEDDPAMGGDSGVDEAAEGEPPLDSQDTGDYIGDMSVDDFKAMLSEMLAPVLKMQDMVKSIGDAHAELKGMYGGVATKDDARNQELITLKAQYAELAQKIATIEGDQPAVILPDEVASALKSAGPSQAQPPDDPAKLAALSDPSRPLAWLGMQTFPELYQNGEST